MAAGSAGLCLARGRKIGGGDAVWGRTPDGHRTDGHLPPVRRSSKFRPGGAVGAPQGAALCCVHPCPHRPVCLFPTRVGSRGPEPRTSKGREQGLEGKTLSFTRAGDIFMVGSFKNGPEPCQGAAGSARRGAAHFQPLSPPRRCLLLKLVAIALCHPRTSRRALLGGFYYSCCFPTATPSRGAPPRSTMWRLAGLSWLCLGLLWLGLL